MKGMVVKLVKAFLHIEGFALLLLSIYFYAYFEFSWFWFLVLLFIPDVSMLGYLIDNKVGAILYNIVHTFSLAAGIIILD